MRNGIVLLALLGLTGLAAQDRHPQEVRQAVDAFFARFHARDTAGLRIFFDDKARLQSIGADGSGAAVLQTTTVSEFLHSIAGIPDTLSFDERLLDYRIRIDGDMAHAWTPYEFYLGGSFHHCGVNSFQFFHDGRGWRIIHLADTRRRAGCKP